MDSEEIVLQQPQFKFPPEDGKQIIMFDGVCNLCDGFVNFIFDRDPSGRFNFVPLQSEYGKYLVQKYGMPANVTSVVYLDGRTGSCSAHSTAVLNVFYDLPGIWHYGYYFIYIPQFIRDIVYRFVAANRYRVFGKKKTQCAYKPGLRKRFLDWYEPEEEACDENETHMLGVKTV